MPIRRTYLTALATAPAAAAAILTALIASPPHVQLSSAPIHNAPLDDVPNVNAPDMIDVRNVDVPNINLPNLNTTCFLIMRMPCDY
jgi:hypothetical protein